MTFTKTRPLDLLVVAPGDFETGGPECIHQLVDSINRQGGSARVLYWPPRPDWTTPPPYRHYDTPIATFNAVTTASHVLLPEIYTHIAGEFRGSQLGLWWLSVDNFLWHGAFPPRTVRRRLRRIAAERLHTRLSRLWLRPYLRRIDFHLTQSEYASEFLAKRGITSTYIGDHTVVSVSASPTTDMRSGGILTNGNKGVALRERFEELNPHLEIRALRGLSSSEVADAMCSADVYIDFGDHPGKDRMPREAALRGCIVATHRAGAAVNPIDVPIPNQFKFDGTDADLRRIGAVLTDVLSDPAPAAQAQAPYREVLAVERETFDRAVASFFEL